MASSISIAERGERLVYRIAGLPVAVSALWLASHGVEADPPAIDSVFAARYWHPIGPGEWLELGLGLVAWPFALLAGSLWFTMRNGRVIKRRTGTGVGAQFADQLRLYFSAGVLAPWYYVFSLHEDGSHARARSFLQRFETKPCVFVLLKTRKGSPLNDKALFAEHCAAHRIRCVETIAQLDGKAPDAILPDCDLFVKRIKGRGGRGAERWDRVAPDEYSGPNRRLLNGRELLDDLVGRSRDRPLVVQPRLQPHHALAKLTTGALPTIRAVTCLNERGGPELIGAVFRMSVGGNRTVDNLHAGGIAAAVDLVTGKLSSASNLGADARLGWLSVHPDTGARIEGSSLPNWEEAKQLAVEAHRVFADRVVVGWDIAILEDGPILIEGNGNPDMDIVQRFMRVGLRAQRFGELIAWHLEHYPSARS